MCLFGKETSRAVHRKAHIHIYDKFTINFPFIPLGLVRSFLLFFVICMPLKLVAQVPQPISTQSLAEKIYLQIDSDLYTNRQTIWLSFTVTEAASNQLSPLSGVLYVELIDAEKRVRDEKMVKLAHGAGKAFFELGDRYLPGKYLIRAYTKWNENFGPAFIATKYIDVYADSANKAFDPIQNITLVEENPDELLLKAEFNPLHLDSLHQKRLEVFLVLDGKKDSIDLKESPTHLYLMEYPVAAENQLVSLGMRTSNGVTYSKTVALQSGQPRVSFYPESGHLLTGIRSKVAFKAKDIQGKGIKIQGEILDDRGQTLTSISSNELGLGWFMLQPDSSRSYQARLYVGEDSTSLFTFDLPKVKSQGKILKVSKYRDKIVVNCLSPNQVSDSTTIRVSSTGKDYYHLQRQMKSGLMTAVLPVNLLPEGVIAFTILDEQQLPQAERLFF